MLTVEELQYNAVACRQGRMSMDDFEDWFRANSRGAYASSVPGLPEAVASVEAAFSKYYFQGGDKPTLLQELVDASRPFVFLSADSSAPLVKLSAPRKMLYTAVAASLLVMVPDLGRISAQYTAEAFETTTVGIDSSQGSDTNSQPPREFVVFVVGAQ